MKAVAAVLFGLGLFACLGSAPGTQEKKDEKKEEKKEEKKDDKVVEAPNLEGKYKLVTGKMNDKALGDDAKKWDFTFTTDKITIKGIEDKKEEKKDDRPNLRFVMGYKIDPKTTPMNIDLEIQEGPEGTKGIKAVGIIETKGDVLKLAYSVEKDKRPKNFDGKEGNMFEFKKEK